MSCFVAQLNSFKCSFMQCDFFFIIFRFFSCRSWCNKKMQKHEWNKKEQQVKIMATNVTHRAKWVCSISWKLEWPGGRAFIGTREYLRMCELCVCVCNCCSRLESNSALVNCSMHSHIEMESWELAGEMGEKAIKRMRKCVFVFRELNFVILFYEAFLKSFYRRCDSFRIWAHVSKVVCVCIIVHLPWFME